MIKAVLFDVGGTMHVAARSAPRQRTYAMTVIKCLREAGLDLHDEPEEFYQKLHQASEVYKAWSEQSGRELPAEQIWNDYYLQPFGPSVHIPAPLAERLSYLHDATRQQLDRRPGLLETVRALSAHGIKLGVISNIISRGFIPDILETYGVLPYMSCVILSSTTGIRKPKAEIFRLAERALTLPPDALAYVGDTISRDVMGVRNAGWRLAIQISNPSIAFRDAHVRGLGFAPDYLIDSLTEIPGIIASVNNERSDK